MKTKLIQFIEINLGDQDINMVIICIQPSADPSLIPHGIEKCLFMLNKRHCSISDSSQKLEIRITHSIHRVKKSPHIHL